MNGKKYSDKYINCLIKKDEKRKVRHKESMKRLKKEGYDKGPITSIETYRKENECFNNRDNL